MSASAEPRGGRRILLTGATGYIGGLLLDRLLASGREVVCLARTPEKIRFAARHRDQIRVVRADMLEPSSLRGVAAGCDAAYYLVHSMGVSDHRFEELDRLAAANFAGAIAASEVRNVIYLGGLGEHHPGISRHLRSRAEVATILRSAGLRVTTLRAAIIIGAGSASFEIIRDLTEKLPLMITPRWLATRCQPIAVDNVIDYLLGVLENPDCHGRAFDIGGPDVLTYRAMLLGYARARRLVRLIVPVPLLTPRLSSYWVQLVTSVPRPLARALVESLRTEVVCGDHAIRMLLPTRLLSYEESIAAVLALDHDGAVPTHWSDATGSGGQQWTPVSGHGILSDVRVIHTSAARAALWRVVSALGGSRGWLYANWIWELRGWLDKLVGGVGLRRGRRDPRAVRVGDALDFWRVELAEPECRLLLRAEMKLPGEAWLEWRLGDREGVREIVQTARFHPRGLLGRAYWLGLKPIHHLIFSGMLRSIVREASSMDAAADGASPRLAAGGER